MADDIIRKCSDCVYYRSANGNDSSKGHIMCHFALDNGFPRLIPPAECYKKTGTGFISKKDKNRKRKMDAMKKRGSFDNEHPAKDREGTI